MKPALIIKASAGTGKTYALAERFISLLLLGEHPSRILATTFTRKAAGEIRDRIFKLLLEFNQDSNQLAKLVERLNINIELDLIAVIRRLIDNQEHLAIQTLDSFFSKIVGCLIPELGIATNWKIAENFELDGLRDQAINALIAKMPINEIDFLLNRTQSQDDRNSVQSDFEAQLKRAYDIFRNSEQDAWKLEFRSRNISEPQYLKAIEEIKALYDFRLNDKSLGKHFVSALNKLLASLVSKDPSDLFYNSLVKKVVQGESKFDRKEIAGFAEPIKLIIEYLAPQQLSMIAQSNLATYELMDLYDRTLNRIKIDQAKFAFDDLKRLLQHAKFHGLLDEIYFRLDTRLPHLLLDEFQDTSLAEWDLLAPIADEIVAKAGLENSFFCVGDVKQSIYAWRGGKSSILDNLDQRWESAVELQSLDHSRRCSESVLNLVNNIFLNLGNLRVLEKHPAVIELWNKRFSKQLSMTGIEGYVEIEKLADKDPELLYQKLVVKVKDLHQNFPTASIAILVRRNEEVSEILNHLTANQILASEEGGVPLIRHVIIQELLELIKWIEFPGDSQAAFCFCNSVYGTGFACEDYRNQAALNQLRFELMDLMIAKGSAGFLLEIQAKLVKLIDSRSLLRLQQLAEILARKSSDTVRNVSLIDQIKHAVAEDPSAARIRVMTIHKSKGLEFDIVVLPELDQDLKSGLKNSYLVESDPLTTKTLKVCRHQGSEIRALSPELTRLYEQTADSVIEEALNLLYVALTRARTAIYLLCKASSEKTTTVSFSNIISEVLELNNGSVYRQGEEYCEVRQLEQNFIEYPLKLSISQAEQWRKAIPVVTASQLEGANEKSVSNLLNFDVNASMSAGRNLHQKLEQIDWLELNSENTLNLHPEILKLFYRSRYKASSITLLKEHHLVALLEQQILKGVIDRLVLSYDQGMLNSAEIIDYKSDEVSRPEFYRSQIEAYRSLVSQAYQIDSKDIICSLAFVKTGEIFQF